MKRNTLVEKMACQVLNPRTQVPSLSNLSASSSNRLALSSRALASLNFSPASLSRLSASSWCSLAAV